MKAAILERENSPLTIGDVEPGALTRGQVMVKVLVSGICGAQLQEIDGYKPAPMPHLLGHEGCGIVNEVGPDVTKVKPGEKVVMHWRKGDGIESGFPSYRMGDRTIGGGKVTTLSEYSIVSENRLTTVPADTSNDFCALLGCGLSTALGIMEKEVRSGETVLIVGIGGVGACCVSAARYARAGAILGMDIYDKRESFFSLGGTFFFTPGFSETRPEPHVIVNTTGSAQSISDTIPLLAPGGRYIIVGQPSPGEDIVIRNAKSMFDGEGKTIKTTQGGGFMPSADIPRYVRSFQNGELSINGIISHRRTLPEINDAIDMMRKGQERRIMVDM